MNVKPEHANDIRVEKKRGCSACDHVFSKRSYFVIKMQMFFLSDIRGQYERKFRDIKLPYVCDDRNRQLKAQ